jgi:hypothetical protein
LTLLVVTFAGMHAFVAWHKRQLKSAAVSEQRNSTRGIMTKTGFESFFVVACNVPCAIPLVPFNTRTATLFFWTHLFQIRHG